MSLTSSTGAPDPCGNSCCIAADHLIANHAAGKDLAAKPLNQLLAIMLVFTVAIALALGRGMAPRCAVA